jgi:hypothetical protein
MGSGISLSKSQVIHIVQRDFLQEYISSVDKRKFAFTADEIYQNCLLDAKFSIINKKLKELNKKN